MGYKAFYKGLVCRHDGHVKQYAENTGFEEKGADACCNEGVMHYCEEPLDCLDYYPLVDENGDITEFAEVEPLGKVLKDGNKRATNKLHIGAKLSLKGFIEAAVKIMIEKGEKGTKDKAATGNASMQAATGYASNQAATGSASNQAATGVCSNQAATGDCSKQAATGDCSKQAATDGDSMQAATGYASKQAATGDYSKQAATGDYSKQAATGDYSKQAATGSDSKQAATGVASMQAATGVASMQAATGDCSKQKMEGLRSVAAGIGKGGRIKGKKGCWMVLAEWEWIAGKYTPVCVKAAQIDGETIKEDTWYTLKNGEFVEEKEE